MPAPSTGSSSTASSSTTPRASAPGFRLQVESTPESPDDLDVRLADVVHRELKVRPVVEIVGAGSLARSTHKSERIVHGDEAFLLGGYRTPNGRYGGSLRDISVVELGGLVLAAALERAGVPGCGGGRGRRLATAARRATAPTPAARWRSAPASQRHVPAMTINMACASGLKAIQLAQQAVLGGTAEIAVALAAESMSRMPYLASHELRWGGVKRGDITLRDGWQDGGTDPICGLNMGQTAERVAEHFGISRADQDAWSVRSHERVAQAWAEGRFAGEVIAVPLPDGAELAQDETFRTDTSVEKLASLQARLQRRRNGHRRQLEPDGRRCGRDRRRERGGRRAVRACSPRRRCARSRQSASTRR